MRTSRRLGTAVGAALAAGLGALAIGSCGSDPRDGITPEQPAREAGQRDSFALERIASGLNRPTWVGVAPGDSGAIWVLEQPGRVVRIEGEERTVVADLTDEVKVGAEQGLLGIAFHPDFAGNRKLYLHYSDRRGDTRVEEAEVRRGSRGIAERRRLLFQKQPEENHNGGQMLFGPDGRLYLGLGDGGGAFDKDNHAQDLDSLLGKLVATDVRERDPRWEVVLYGLRNPWRFWFDNALGEVWIGDVGQDDVEEVDRLLLEPDEPPKNLGWAAFEGSDRTTKKRGVSGPGELVWPVASYEHDDGAHCSVTAGLIYRGPAAPRLAGRYVYGDFCSGTIWSLEPTPQGRARDVRREKAKVQGITHIGSDTRGELLVAAASGELYRSSAPR